ncbi:MAG: hypothetical protein ABL995_04835 [Bryobacteraceae bacterium]
MAYGLGYVGAATVEIHSFFQQSRAGSGRALNQKAAKSAVADVSGNGLFDGGGRGRRFFSNPPFAVPYILPMMLKVALEEFRDQI